MIITLSSFLGYRHCILWGLSSILALLLMELSLITIVILSLQSYITLAYPYNWESIITKYRLNIVFLISWTFVLIKTAVMFNNTRFIVYAKLCIVCLTVITVTVIWTWTYKLVARHRNVIQSTQTSSSEVIKQKKIVRSTVTALAVVLSLVTCYILDIICVFMFDRYSNASNNDSFATFWSVS